MDSDTETPEMEGYELWPATLLTRKHNEKLCHNLAPKEVEKGESQLFSNEFAFADPDHFHELVSRSESGEAYKSSLARLYEDKQANAMSLLNEQLETLKMQRFEAEKLQGQILNEQLYESSYNPEDGCGVSDESPPRSDVFPGDDGPGSWSSLPTSEFSITELEGDHSAEYWRDRARGFSKMLSESIQREELLEKKLQELTSGPPAMQPLEDLGLLPNHFDEFLRFCLKKAPIIVAHQDVDLRYRFIYNAFPTLTEEDVIGKTDMEILDGGGMLELVEFKKEVMRKGWPEKREFTFNTDLFGEKTFLIALEPVMNKSGQPIGLNYVSVDISEQVVKRERLMCLREEVAVQKAMETELNRTIHITEETMRAKQMLATMSHEIRSPLSGVVSVAEVLATTHLDAEQRQLVDVMLSSGDLVLQLINDILDLSKVESGAMKLEAKKFRLREVVKHVLRTAAASVQNKNLDLQEIVNDDVPLEVIGDVLRIRQVFTNLVSNAVKFTHEGGVKIVVRLVPPPNLAKGNYSNLHLGEVCESLHNVSLEEISQLKSPLSQTPVACERLDLDPQQDAMPVKTTTKDMIEGSSASTSVIPIQEPVEGIRETIWLQCDICDTGIGIPEEALPALFEKYTQASTTHARQYGGTGLGLAICKNLVELMGGSITVRSKVNEGSMFSFTLPLQVAEQTLSSTGQSNDNLYSIMSNEQEHSFDRRSQDYSSFRKSRVYPDFAANSNVSSTRPRFSRPDSRRPNLAVFSTGTEVQSLPSSSKMNRRDTVRNIASGKPNLGPLPKAKTEGHHIGASKIDRSSPTKSRHTVNSPAEDSDFRMNNTSTLDSMLGQSMDTIGTRTSEGGQASTGQTSLSKPPSQTDTARGSRKSTGKGPVGEREGVLLQGSGTQQRPARILLVEDNKVNVMVAQSMLMKLGHTLEVANNGADAILALQQNSYDLILMDVCMPVMDGLEATWRIRKYEETGFWVDAQDGKANRIVGGDSDEFPPDVRFADAPPPRNLPRQRTPIIAMTANALADNMSECYSHGMDSFIAKPVTFTKLQQALKQFIPCPDVAGSPTGKSNPTGDVQTSTFHWKNQDGRGDEG